MKIRKISRRRSCSPKYSELGHFMWLFCRGRLRNVPRIIMHEHSHCSTHFKTFCLVTLSLPSSSRLAQTSCFKIAKKWFHIMFTELLNSQKKSKSHFSLQYLQVDRWWERTKSSTKLYCQILRTDDRWSVKRIDVWNLRPTRNSSSQTRSYFIKFKQTKQIIAVTVVWISKLD